MDIHKPHAAKTWREFFVELGTIVVGILIALGLEQSVEMVREHGLAHEAEQAIAAGMQEDLDRVGYRLAQQPCIDRRLDEFARLLADWKDGKAPPSGLRIGDPGDVPPVDQRWQANLNSGRFSREPPAEQSEQASLYTSLAIYADMGKREHYAWSALRALELTAVLSPDLRPGLVAALQEARTDASDIRQLGREIIDKSRRAGRTPRAYSVVAIAGSSCRPLR
jgi:hypothetical protein